MKITYGGDWTIFRFQLIQYKMRQCRTITLISIIRQKNLAYKIQIPTQNDMAKSIKANEIITVVAKIQNIQGVP